VPNQPQQLVVCCSDTSVLINFIHIDRLDLLGPPLGLRVVIPAEVDTEVNDPPQRRILQPALRSKALQIVNVTGIDEVTRFAGLRAALGPGEAACLAIAATRGWMVACDERRVFLREATAMLGSGRIATTPGLLLRAIRRDVLTVAEADNYKAHLEKYRFRVKFTSFQELLDDPDE
jgi:predicted nucleic acid-binding protein